MFKIVDALRPRVVLLATIIILLTIIFAFRSRVCGRVVGYLNHKYLAARGMQMSYNDLRIKGLKTIHIEGLSIVLANDTILHCQNFLVNPSFKTLLTGKLYLRRCALKGSRIHLPLDSLFRPDSGNRKTMTPGSGRKDIPGIIAKILRNTRPDRIRYAHLEKMTIEMVKSNDTSYFFVPIAEKVKHHFDASVVSGKVSVEQNHFTLSGDIYNNDIQLFVHNYGKEIVSFPLLQNLTGTRVGFDSLYGRVCLAVDGKVSRMRVEGGLFNSRWLNRRLSSEMVRLDTLSLRLGLSFAPGWAEMDSTSFASVNGIDFRPYIRFSCKHEDSLKVRLLPTEWKAESFFGCLPAGLFEEVRQIKARGRMFFYMDFAVNLQQPDSLHFDMQLRGRDLHFVSGLGPFTRLRDTFTHRVYDRGQYVKEIAVGAGNTTFVPLDAISPFLKYAVLTSEDGGFYHHQGFNKEAFAGAIAQNIRERRFARGGSTISMQLVKNLYLNRNKNVFRKVEEALIVWIIERNRLVSKDRMLEVYFNIIEWGPGVYGIGPASQFYFSKSPSKLTLFESIYLASIIPRPKAFRYSFETNGQLKPFFVPYYQLVTGIMVRRGQLIPSDTVGGLQPLWLNGEAERWLAAADTVAADSLPEEFVPFGIVDTTGWK